MPYLHGLLYLSSLFNGLMHLNGRLKGGIFLNHDLKELFSEACDLDPDPEIYDLGLQGYFSNNSCFIMCSPGICNGL